MRLLTNLLFEPKGMHNQNAAYNIKDTVMSADGSRVYFALQDVPAGTALDNEDYWKLQIDLSGSKSAMDQALASFGNYAKVIGMRVRGETAKASGNPVTFLPDAGSLIQPVTVLEPQQQGSGDPYPAGSGKNLLPITAKTQTINGVTFTVDNGVITANGKATANAYLWLCDEFTLQPGTYVMSGIPENFNYDTQGGFTDDNWNINRYGVTTLTEAKKVKPYIVVRNGVTANNVIFKLQLEVGSTPTAFAPYSNIRPFIGYDKLGLTAAGKNLLNNIRYYDSTHTDIRAQYDSPLLLKTGVKYVLSTNFQADGLFFVDAAGNGSLEAQYLLNYQYQTSALEYTPTRDIECIFVAIFNSGVPNGATIQLEVGSATAYEPHQGKAYTVQTGQTICGGRFDWLTGKLVVEWAGITFGADTPFSAWGNDLPHLFTFSLADAPVDWDVLCSHYTQHESYDKNGAYIIPQSKLLLINDIRFDNVDAFNAEIAAQNAAGTPVQIAYKLASPIEIQLTPHIISAADPEQTNTLYGDGRIDVEYVKPLHVSIEERVAAAMQTE